MKIHARVEGRVQGVGFRYWVVRVAMDLGLTGSVGNLPDGSVEVEAWGDQISLETFEQRLGTGPALARVTSVTIERNPAPKEPPPPDFRISR